MWSEWRGDTWSKTNYTGLYFLIKEWPVLVSRLSHGLRVIPIKNQKDYLFGSILPAIVEVPDSFIQEVETALEADVKFQKQIDVFEKAMRENPHP